MRTGPRRMGYVPALDGLRALAIIAVVIFHSPFAHLLPGGWAGVDVFFAISGFLITELLLEEMGEQKSSLRFRAFYARRLLRLAPPLIVVLLTALVLAVFTGRPHLLGWAGQAAMSATYTINYWVAAGHVPHFPFAQMWSLAVEEHFYLLWPAVLWATSRRCPPRTVAAVTGGIVLLVVGWRSAILLTGHASGPLYVRTDTRLDAILIGCLAAQFHYNGWVTARARRLLPAMVVIGAASVAMWMLTLSPYVRWIYFGPIDMIAAAASVACLGSVTYRSGWWTRLLSVRPLVFVGKLSYSVYLWHMVFVEFSPVRNRRSAETATFVVLTAVAATASYFIVERPAGKLRARFRPENASARPAGAP